MTAQTCDRVPVRARRRAHQLRRAASALRLRSGVMPRQFGGQTSHGGRILLQVHSASSRSLSTGRDPE
ncbi:hypothetical protein [Rhodococcus sp. 24CO]|uniref:hypothetical protein n=1 Tax=Rhodococcus sp. 24CO TaxID=3117460 RepID=UPI003D342687